LVLIELGAEVIGYSLNPNSSEDLFVVAHIDELITDYRGDIRDSGYLKSTMIKHQPEIIFHLAAQPLVIESYKNPHETWEINVMGTINVLEGIRITKSVKIGIFVTTDKVYENLEKDSGYLETDRLGGYDPYSSSKASAELAISSWRQSFFNPDSHLIHGKAISSVRAGNVIGGGDWSEDRLIPDIIRAIEGNTELIIRNPNSIRPWQHVVEPLNGYLILGQKMFEDPVFYSQAWNFGPKNESAVSVYNIVEQIRERIPDLKVVYGKNDNSIHETNTLVLDSQKARTFLTWEKFININVSIDLCLDYYLSNKKIDYYLIVKNQIKDFLEGTLC
jgi:CDP-glucose 4,6-dehydratase